MHVFLKSAVLLWVYVFCIGQLAFADEVTTTSSSEAQFRQAVTWYKVARATENGMEAHSRAAELYQQAFDNTDDPMLKAAAQKGIDQAVFRIDNAHDIYRTLFDPIWWISDVDPTIEWYDDVYMLALGNSWNAVEAHLSKELEPENHVAVVYVTRNGDLPNVLLDTGAEDFESNRDYRLKLMRDEIIGFAEATPSMTGIPDDLMPMVQEWIFKPALTGNDVVELTKRLNTQGVVLIHANIDDEIQPTKEYLGVVRISLSTQFWRSGEDAPYATIKSVGVGQDAQAHHQMAIYWLIGVFACAFGLSVWTANKRLGLLRMLFVTGVTFLIGGIWSHLSFAFAADYQVDWGQASLIFENDTLQIPYLPSMQWSWVLALVLLNGPILILGWALSKLDVVIHALIPNKELQWSLLLPTMLAGALAWLFLPLVRAHSAGGIWIAIPLTISIVYTAWRLSPVTAQLFQGQGDLKSLSVILVCTMIGLSFAFPIGLFNNWHWIMSIALLVVGTYIKAPQIEMLLDHSEIDTNAKNPFMNFPLSKEHEKVVGEIVSALNAGESVCVNDDGLIGDSSIFVEVKNQLMKSKSKQVDVVRLKCLETDQEPFAFIQRLLTGGSVESASPENSGNLLTESVDNIVSALPGVEFVMGLLGDSASGLSRDAIVKDLIAALEHRLKKTKHIWLIDNGSNMDAGSIEVLQTVFAKSDRLQIVWEQHSSQSVFFDGLEVPYTTVAVPNFDTYESLEVYLHANKVVDLPRELLVEITTITGGGLEQVKQVLAYLFDQDQLQQDVDGNIRSLIDLTEGGIGELLPDDYATFELQRLEILSDPDRLILECASVCGTIFYAEEIATALELSIVHVLERLEVLERMLNPPMIEDVEGEPGVFQFGSRLTRDVLLRRLRYGSTGSGQPREFTIHLHRQILSALKSNQTLVPLNRQVYHATQIRHIDPSFYVVSVLGYFDELHDQFAWPEVIELFGKSRGYLQLFDAAANRRLQMIYAKAVRYHPDTEYFRQIESIHFDILNIQEKDVYSNTHAAMQILANVLEKSLRLSGVELFVLVKDFCQISFAPWEPGQKDRFVLYANELRVHLVNVPQLYLDSFIHSSNSRDVNVTPDLKNLVDTLRTLSVSSEQQFALGSILKEYAGQHLHHSTSEMTLEEKTDFWYQEIVPLYDEANRLMLEQKDWSGLAVSYGIQANMYLFGFKEYDKALVLLQKDLQLVEQYHFVAYESGIRGRMSLAYQGMLEHLLTEDSTDLERCIETLNSAEREASSAKAIAVRLGSTRDAGMAESSLTKIAELKIQVDQIST